MGKEVVYGLDFWCNWTPEPEHRRSSTGMKMARNSHAMNFARPQKTTGKPGYLQAIWPRNRGNVSPAIAESLGRLCVAAEDAFPDALGLLRAWLRPPAQPVSLVRQLHKSGLCDRFPAQALDLLSLVIGEQTEWPPRDLGSCLQAIQSAMPELAGDPRFERLEVFQRQRGLG